MYYILVIIAAIFSALTVTMIKLYDYNNFNNLFLLVACLSQLGLIFSYVQLLKFNDILTLFTLIKILAILLVSIIGVVFFGFKLTKYKILGILLGIIAIYLLQ
jgi:multidrug transporter EmrE-like cation transporter